MKAQTAKTKNITQVINNYWSIIIIFCCDYFDSVYYYSYAVLDM